MKKQTRVLAAMSGGVDSSVAAAILKQKGYDVIGITMDIWPAKADNFGGCCSASAVEDAKNVADRIGIPHYVLNFRSEFKEAVIDNFIGEYQKGRTPNPCVRCNQIIKFDKLLRKADELGADLIATGHYAIIEKDKKGFKLKKATDPKKDQSYFLYVMDQNVLKRTLFPVGGIPKTRTREIARKLGLTVADKKDSQDICFIDNNDYGKFLSAASPELMKPGNILDIDGNRVGMHRGIAFYTVGQRKGMGLPFGKPFYVIKIERETNSIIVGEDQDTFGKELVADNIVWTSDEKPAKEFKADIKIRHSTDTAPATVYPEKNGSVRILFKKPVRSITPGQSAVFYKGNVVVGGGIIC